MGLQSLTMPSPLGDLTIFGTIDQIVMIAFEKEKGLPAEPGKNGLLLDAKKQLEEYFAGIRTEFTLPLDLQGTPFRQRVWGQMKQIPYGTVVTYSQLAQQIGLPSGARAVGGACHNNPLPIVIPCHRVVGANGALTGYAGGLERKRYLLQMEGLPVSDAKL